ncbi:MAG: copper chaperone PCu(A)C [Gammaproteobacteria bacterium]
MRKIIGLLFLLPLLAQAEYLSVENAWVRAAPPTSQMTAAYASIHNQREYDIWITGAESSAHKTAELHETVEENGLARMMHLKFLKLAPGETVHFKPGGKHFMLFTPSQPLNPGDKVQIGLKLGNGDTETFEAVVSRGQP